LTVVKGCDVDQPRNLAKIGHGRIIPGIDIINPFVFWLFTDILYLWVHITKAV